MDGAHKMGGQVQVKGNRREKKGRRKQTMRGKREKQV